MEAFRQMLGTVYVPLADVAGEGVLADADRIIEDAIDNGADKIPMSALLFAP